MNTLSSNNHKNSLRIVDWSQVRPIYKKLSDEFEVLTSSFSFKLTKTSKIHLDYLIIAIDVVDEVLDEIELKEDRDLLSRQMVEFLKGDDSLLQNRFSSILLNQRLNDLRKIIQYSSSIEIFVKAAEDIFHFTESKRHVQNKRDLLDQVQIEGKATAAMTLALMEAEATAEFRDFFSRLCQLMGIVDLIFDAREDYKSNKIKIAPSIGLYFSLVKITIVSGLSIFFLAPRKWTFIKYCVRFSMTLFKGG